MVRLSVQIHANIDYLSKSREGWRFSLPTNSEGRNGAIEGQKKKGKWNRIKISVDMSVRRRQSDVQTFKQVRLMFKNYLVVSKWSRLNPY